MINYAPLTKSQSEYIRRSQESWLNVAEGGKRAGKNIINLIAWAASLETHPEKIHLAAGVSLSAARMNILDSNGYGLKYLFAGRYREGKYEGREAAFIRTPAGEKVILISGGKKVDDAARIKGHSYGSAYITEVNEVNEVFFREVVDRTLASRRRQLFFDLNPKNPSHWFYRDFLDYQDEQKKLGKNPGYNYGHFTILGNLSIPEERLRTVLAQYNRESLWFQTDILGRRLAASGRIYGDYERSRIAVDAAGIARQRFTELTVGIDVGGTDATCAVVTGFTPGWREVWHIASLYHKQGISEKMTEARYASLIADWIAPYKRRYPRLVNCYVDSAAKLFRAALREELAKRRIGVRVIPSDKGDGILQRIELTCMLLMQGRLRAAADMAQWHEAMEAAVWDEGEYEKGGWARLDNGSYPVDALDAAEYSVYPMKRFLEAQGSPRPERSEATTP